MPAHSETPLGPVASRLRRLYQRWFTKLPRDLVRFEALFPPHCNYITGIFAQRPRFTGGLVRETGAPFFVSATRYLAGVGSNLGSENESYWTHEPDRIAFAMSDAGVYGNHGRVYDPRTRTFIAETCEDWDHHFDRSPVMARPGFPAAERLPGTSLLLSTLGGQTFYHFFVETLPKLALLRPFLGHCDRILVSRYGEEWKRRWLRLWGLEHKAVFIHELSHYVCDQLLFTNRLVRHFEAGPWAVKTLRQTPGLVVAQTPPAEGRVLWLDRTRDHMRPVAWEKELQAAMPWVQPVCVADLTPVQAAELFGSARIIFGFHGAAFANMVFTPPGARVIEVFTEPNYPWYARLAQSCGHDHSALALSEELASPAKLAAFLRAAALA